MKAYGYLRVPVISDDPDGDSVAGRLRIVRRSKDLRVDPVAEIFEDRCPVDTPAFERDGLQSLLAAITEGDHVIIDQLVSLGSPLQGPFILAALAESGVNVHVVDGYAGKPWDMTPDGAEMVLGVFRAFSSPRPEVLAGDAQA